MARSPSPSAPGRPFDIEIGTQEVITVDLDALDPDPSDVVDVLKDGAGALVWSKFASEYWRQGHLGAAEQIARSAVDTLNEGSKRGHLPPIYALLSNLQIAHARKAPKLILPNPRQDNMKAEKAQEYFHREAMTHLNAGDKALLEADEPSRLKNVLSLLTRGISQLTMRNLDEAHRSFDAVLAEKPTNLIALMGKARILYVRRQFQQALKLFQQVLQLSPHCLPDPRIGIGLCLWAMDYKAKARTAWQRSLEVHPTSWPAQLLLGLDAVNTSKNENQTDAERARAFVTGTKLIERAFHANQRNAAAANALCDVLVRKGQLKKAMKLAERTIQFADTLTLLTEGRTRAGRVAHAEGALEEATSHFTAAAEGSKSAVASVGLAQVQIKNDEFAAAIHTLDTLLQQTSTQKSLEATVMLASLRAHARPGVSSADAAKEKARARELFDIVCKALDPHLPSDKPVSRSNGHMNGASAPTLTRAHRRIGEDVDMHAEIARLWQGEDLGRAKRALREGLRLSEAAPHGRPDPRLMNNVGTISHLEDDLLEARKMYERALTVATGEGFEPELAEGMSTSILYNLARVYEGLGEEGMAKEAYDKLLSRHPEYTDAKIRQAHLLAEVKQYDGAHELLKQSLTSHLDDLNLRAAYTHFLIQANLLKNAKQFVFTTLQDFDKHDIYSLCAAGLIQYMQARESRDGTPRGIEDRKKGFKRAADFYEKALTLDPLCAFAAQGLAIGTAEDALGSLGGSLAPAAPDEGTRRAKNARDALDVFGKVRESINDGSVYVNMGHCFYNRDEYDRAIESYETASKRYYAGHNVPVLLCLCRAWFAKSTKDQSFSAMNTALGYAQQAFHIQPQDKAIMYNIAMIQQKAAQMLFSVPPTKRSLKDMQRAIEQAGQAQKLFASLASDPSPMVPYDRDLADERRKYGEGMLRKGDEHLATQRQYETEVQAKLGAARQKRQEEKDRLKLEEDALLAGKRQAAEKLAEERRLAREQALEWTREVKQESDEEKEKKAKRASRKVNKVDGGASGDEGAPEPKKRRPRRKKVDAGDEDEEALFSANEEEGDSKPVKKRPSKKRVVRDEDDEEVVGAPRRKQIKSKEMIEDSDEEMA